MTNTKQRETRIPTGGSYQRSAGVPALRDGTLWAARRVHRLPLLVLVLAVLSACAAPGGQATDPSAAPVAAGDPRGALAAPEASTSLPDRPRASTSLPDRPRATTSLPDRPEASATLPAHAMASAATEAASAAPRAAGGGQAPHAEVYIDPAGRFSVPIPTGWMAEQRDGFVVLSDPDNQITAYALVLEQTDPAAAVADAWWRVDPAFTSAPAQVQQQPPTGSVEKIVDVTYEADDGRERSGRGQLYGGSTYVLLVDADPVALHQRAAQVDILRTGYTISAIPVVDLRAVTPARVDAAITSELGAFTERMLERFGVPGAAVAVVQDGAVVYLDAFGVRNAETHEPMTPQTRMMIGSTGKSLTTMMMATLVDDGTIAWDMPAKRILPSFAVNDPALSEEITMRNLVCACTGVPRRDLELVFNGNELSAEDIVASLASFELYTPIGEAFQYSNQLVASGGYIASVAAGHAPGDLLADYSATLEARVLDPIGMPHTTLSFADVQASGNYAVPHSPDLVLDAAYVPRPLETEQVLRSVAPAGAHWSTAEDMANYLITELNRGVAPTGTRVVSAENLQLTWQPQVPVDATTQYGLGWFVGDYKQQPLIYHGGNTLGFTSDVAFLPEANLGIVVLANGQNTSALNQAIRTRLWELVFAQPPEAEASATFTLDQTTAETAALAMQLGATIDVAAITPFLGRYSNEALGEMTLRLEHDALVLDSGEFRSHLKPLSAETGVPNTYVLVDQPAPSVLFVFGHDDTGKPTMALEFGADQYTFTRPE